MADDVAGPRTLANTARVSELRGGKASSKTMAIALTTASAVTCTATLDGEMPEQPWERLSAPYKHRLENHSLS